MSWRSGVPASVFAAFLLVAGATSASAEGFFEALGNLFGNHQPAPERGYYGAPGPEPLRMRVQPRRERLGRKSLRRGHRRAVASVPKAPLVKIDPDKDPTWYLGDPTLRRGDIVVVKGGVIVFDGAAGAQHGSDDFVALAETPLVPPSTQREVADAVAGWAAPTPAVAATASNDGKRTRRTSKAASR